MDRTVFSRLLGARIRKRRLFRGLSLQALATLAGVAKGYLSQVENGITSPNSFQLFAIAKALKVKADRLLTGGAEGRAA